MPYSAVHFELGLKQKKKFKTDDKSFLDFLVGSIFVDASYLLKGKKGGVTRGQTHYYKEGDYEKEDFALNFKKSELGKQSAFKLGYYYHLLLDLLWRDSEFLKTLYREPNLEWIYQFSRKLYTNRDLKKIGKSLAAKKLIKDLYKYKFDKKDIPEIFKNFEAPELEATFYELLDYMLEKKVFFKKSEKQEGYTIKSGSIIVQSQELKSDLRKYFPYSEYKKLKKKGEKEFEKVEKFLKEE